MRTYDYSYDCKENYYALLVAILDNKSVSKALKVSIDLLVGNDIQNLLEQKVNNVESEVIRNNKLLRMSLIILAIIVVILILAFISLA